MDSKMYSRAYIEITNTCNMHCSFCHGTSRAPKQMSLGEFARITANLRGITEYLYLHVLGEPLSHSMLPIFIEHANRCGFKVAITTNGTLLGVMGEKLLLSRPYKINISLHSFEGESESARRAYVASCLDFADKASEAGILVVLRLWNIGAHDGTDTKNDVVFEMLHEKFGEFENLSVRGARIKDKLHVEIGKRFDWPDINATDLGERVFCHGLGDHFAILADGTVVPCCLDADAAIPLGNIFEKDIRDILACERATNIKNGFSQKRAVEDLCRRCGYARRFKV